MTATSTTLDAFYEILNLYPSPHNGQPIQIRQGAADTFELYFNRERGLQATDVSYIFSFVSMGVFVRHMEYAAAALGHAMSCVLELPAETALRGRGIVRFARVTMQWNDKAPDVELEKTLRFRQTSRKKYTAGPTEALCGDLAKLSSETHKLIALDAAQTHQAIWLNQRAVFDDMFDEPVRQELDHWLRYSKHEKETKQDGLAYDCMQINGAAMKFVVHHPKLLRAPGVARLLQSYYLRTMKDESVVYYMRSPFVSEENAFDAGLKIMEVWQHVAAHRQYLHPFGTIMSNHQAHQDFLRLAGIADESRRSYLVFIFRLGRSSPPVLSARIPYQKHLIMESKNS